MAILDTGKRREFSTGAVRDNGEGRGRCDLLPLDVIADTVENRIFKHIDNYIRSGNLTYLLAAIHEFQAKYYENYYTALLELAKHYEEGAVKYAERNWEQGIPLHCYIDSGVRHYLKLLRGDTDEPHDRAFLWNMFGAIWTHKHLPKMIDLPFKEKKV